MCQLLIFWVTAVVAHPLGICLKNTFILWLIVPCNNHCDCYCCWVMYVLPFQFTLHLMHMKADHIGGNVNGAELLWVNLWQTCVCLSVYSCRSCIKVRDYMDFIDHYVTWLVYRVDLSMPLLFKFIFSSDISREYCLLKQYYYCVLLGEQISRLLVKNKPKN